MANHFANLIIGDFSSTNRPRIFQGAAGMPLGLFQTFMWNYFQRMFSYIENGANRALAAKLEAFRNLGLKVWLCGTEHGLV